MLMRWRFIVRMLCWAALALASAGCVGGAETAVFIPTPEPAPTATLAPTATFPLPTATVSPTLTPTATAIAAPQFTRSTYRVLNSYPHDPEAYTQGLAFDAGGNLFEGTGLWGQSSLRRVDLATGAVLQRLDLDAQYFGEGITLLGDRIIQLTWQSQTGFVYDRDSFALLQTFRYPTEGWGITHDGARLIMSDGTATLYFWDPHTLAEIGRVVVVGLDGPVPRLNELEYVNGEVWANVWLTDEIVRIDPATGRVVGVIDLAGLRPAAAAGADDVLNGIAYDAKNGRLFVTGKRWPTLFEIEPISSP
jgi:glutaminyl-peptide cyclotransferase